MNPIYRLLLLVCLAFLSPQIIRAEANIDQLEHEMYRLFYSEDSLKFRQAVSELKKASLAAGNEQKFYQAWGNEAIYECTHHRRTHGLQIARQIYDYADQHNSAFGKYTAIHVSGTVYHQMRDYDNAEKTFLEAIDFLHKNAPGESAAADYIELVLISVNGHNNVDQGLAYAVEALDEPHVSDQHRMRVLTMLCQLEGEKADPDPETFNIYYEDRLQVKQSTPPDRADIDVEYLHHFVNRDYDGALRLVDSLKHKELRIYERARIYHKLGRDHEAYLLMVNFKQTRDSIFRAERTDLLAEYIAQLNMERLEKENMELEDRVEKLMIALFVVFALAFIGLLVWIIRKRAKQNKQLLHEKDEADKARQEAQEAHITEREERRKAERELDVKREFLNNIAKELRSPLSPITGFSDILAAGEIELSPEEREAMNLHIKESSQALTSIIDNMIELSYYESKSKLDKTEVFSPILVCQNAIDYANRQYHKPDVEVTLYTTLGEEVTMKSDMQAVGKVLRQLVDNAMKFTEKGGVLIHLSETAEGMFRFMVVDSGIGIEENMRKKIFAPLIHDRHSVSTTKMGLAICSNIVNLLGGKIWLDETYKKECRFIFEIPKA